MDQESRAAWKGMQDGFASLTGLSLLSFDSQLTPFIEPSHDNPICAAVQRTETGAQHCRAHCGKALMTVQRIREPLFLKCEANLHVFTIPILVGNEVRLLLQGGKRFVAEQERKWADRIAEQTGLPRDAFLELSRPQPPIQNAHLLTAARYLEQAARFPFESHHVRTTIGAKFSSLLTLFTLIGELKQDADLETFYATVLGSIGVLFDVNTAAILAVNLAEDTTTISQTFGQNKDLFQGYRTSPRDCLIGQVVSERRRLGTRDTLDILKMGLPASVRSVELFPMIIPDGDAASLILVLDSALAEEDLQILEAFSAQAGLVLHNRLLLNRVQKSSRHLSELTRIIQELGSTLDTDRLLELVLDRSAALVQAEKGSLMLLDEKEGSLAIKAMKGLSKKLLDPVRIAPNQGICGRVMATGTPLLVSDLEKDERIGQKQKPRYRTKSFISVPLKLENRTIGVLNISDKITGEVFSPEDLKSLCSVADYVSVAIERSALYQKSEELKRISILDPLTGLVNRRHFEDRLLEEVQRSRRHQVPFSLLMVDLDNFKVINDTFGHQAGDEVLRITARVIRNTIRTIDLAARYGGEEFAIILPQTAKPGASIIAERICAEFRKLDLPFQYQDRRPTITGSLGLACCPDDADTPEGLIHQADIALYNAKARGKNRVVVFGET